MLLNIKVVIFFLFLNLNYQVLCWLVLLKYFCISWLNFIILRFINSIIKLIIGINWRLNKLLHHCFRLLLLYQLIPCGVQLLSNIAFLIFLIRLLLAFFNPFLHLRYLFSNIIDISFFSRLTLILDSFLSFLEIFFGNCSFLLDKPTIERYSVVAEREYEVE